VIEETPRPIEPAALSVSVLGQFEYTDARGELPRRLGLHRIGDYRNGEFRHIGSDLEYEE
jgi:hypothetical protein